MSNIVQFNNQDLQVIEYENQRWFTSVDIANALSFSKPNAVTKIYNNHKSEFEFGMSCLPKSGKQRIFNREGAWLIGMFARTPKAAEFRKWVLKVLGAVSGGQLQPAPVDMRAIGGVVKKCAAVAVREELKDVLGKEVKEVIRDQFLAFVTRTFAAARDLQPFQQVTDDMLLRGLYDWYSTKHHEHIRTIQDLTAENDCLKSKMATIRKTAAE